MIDLWLPPKPAIIRPHKPELVRASFLPGMFPAGAIAAAGPPTLVADGVGDALATSFILNPTTLGAAVGDIMVVCAAWETDTTNVTAPGGWTEHVDQKAPESTRQVSIHSIVFSGSVPGNQTFSYTGTNGVTYAWAIVRNASSVESAVYSDGSTAGTAGADSITITLSGTRLAAVVAMCVDGNSETGETATFSGVTNVVTSGSGHAGGRFAMVGFTTVSATASYTTTAFLRNQCGNYTVYVQ